MTLTENSTSKNALPYIFKRVNVVIRNIYDYYQIKMLLFNRMEAQQRGVDHNIMRHINQAIATDDNYEDDDYELDEFRDDQKEQKDQRPVPLSKKLIPNNEVKKNMRVALFGFLEASQNDEDELVSLFRSAGAWGVIRISIRLQLT